MEADEKVCPYCAETIKAAAIVCKHCGRDLVIGPSSPQSAHLPIDIRVSTVNENAPRFTQVSPASAVDASVPYPTHQQATTGAIENKPGLTPVQILLIVGLVVGTLWALSVSVFSDKGSVATSTITDTVPMPQPEETRDHAATMAKDFVTKQLKSPSTAEFPTINNMDVQVLGNNTFRVKSYVDAQNAFGGTVRSNFTVKLHYKPADDSWYMDDIDVVARQ